MPRRRKSLPKMPLFVTGALLVALVGWLAVAEAEPLTDEEILEKTSWNDEELVVALTRVGSQRRERIRRRSESGERNWGGRNKVMAHLREQVRGLPPERREAVTRQVMERSLDQAREQGRVKSGDLVCLAAFGAGFTWGAALIRW